MPTSKHWGWAALLPFNRKKERSSDEGAGDDIMQQKQQAKRTMLQKGFYAQWGSALLYAVVAVAMNFINRHALHIYPMPTVLLMIQMLATVAILHPLHACGVLSFSTKLSWARCRQLLLISSLYTGNTAFALFGLKTLNVPMYSTLKRLTCMLVLVCKAVIRRRMPSFPITAAVFLVVIGGVVAGLGDVSFDPLGYTFALLSCSTQAAYLLLVEFQGAGGATTSELLYYNALTSIPLVGLIMVGNHELFTWRQAWMQGMAQHGTFWFSFIVLSCSVMGCLLNYSLFLCTMHNSALTTTIVGVMKGVVAVLLGFFIDTVAIHPLNVFGICLNTAGGVWYTSAKYHEKQRSMRRSIIVSASIEPLNMMAGPGEMGSDDEVGSKGNRHVYLRVDSTGRGMFLAGASERLLSSDSASSLQGESQGQHWHQEQLEQQQRNQGQQEQHQNGVGWHYQDPPHEQPMVPSHQYMQQQQQQLLHLHHHHHQPEQQHYELQRQHWQAQQ